MNAPASRSNVARLLGVARLLRGVLLVAVGVGFETLAMPPGPVPALVFLQDAPFLLLLGRPGRSWHAWAIFYGFVRFAVGLRWLAEVQPAMVFGAAFVLALGQWAWGGAIRFLVRRGRPWVPVVAVTAVLQEMLQTVIQGSSGMPWPTRSLAFTAWPTMLGVASLAGAYGVSALAAATSAWAAGLPALRHGDGGRPERARTLIVSGSLLGVVAAVAVLAGALERAEVRARLEGPNAVAGRTEPLVLVQACVLQSLKNDRHEANAANEIFNRHLAQTTEALTTLVDEGKHALAVAWPETMVPWPFLDRALAVRFPREWAMQHTVLTETRKAVPAGAFRDGMPFLLGVNHFFVGERGEHPDLDDHDVHDTMVCVDLARVPDEPPDPATWPASGLWPWERAPGRHDKTLLVPWGEYTPGGGWIPGLRRLREHISIIPEITPGEPDRAPFHLGTVGPEVRGGPNRPVLVGAVVCFEIAFPACCRAWRARGATVLVNAGNYAWYGDTGMPAQLRAIARLRAAELAATVVVAGNTGPTCIIDPAGDVRTQVVRDGKAQFVPGWCAGPLYVDPGYRTLYLRVGDAPWFAAAGWLLLRALIRRRRVRDGSDVGSAPSDREAAAGPAPSGADASPAAPAG